MQYKFTYRKKDNGWQVILSYKKGNAWKQKSKQGFESKRAAQMYGTNLLEQVEKEKGLTEDKRLQGITFGQFVDVYCDARKNDVRESTLYHYEQLKTAFPGLAQMAMTDITYLDVVTDLNEYRESHNDLTTSTIFTCLRTLFKAATTKYKVIPSNPTDGVKIKRGKADKKTLTDSQVHSLLNSLDAGHKLMDTMIYMLAVTGCRFGEIAGLCLTDIGKDCIHIRRQYNRITMTEYGFTETKNAGGVRTIPVSHKALATLREYIANRKTVPADGRIFGTTNGTRTMINDRLKELTGDGYSVHCLRHTYATRLIASGMDVQTVAALMGDTVTTVLKNYSHYTDDMRRKAAEKIEAMF